LQEAFLLHSKNATPINATPIRECNTNKKCNTKMKTEYKQRLPHIQPIGAAFFVTFRLYESVPKSKITELKDKYEIEINIAKTIKDLHQSNFEIFNLRKQYLVEYDQLLDKIKGGPMYLADQSIKDILKVQLHRFDNDLYQLLCYCIMSNHVHLLIDTSIQLEDKHDDYQLEMQYKPLDSIMKSIKGPSAWYANIYLDRKGQFWERESFDLYIRNEKMLNNVINYILENPVKAKMVEKWDDYSGNYLKIES
jgi:REP element-mobilizing transposase RayT